MNPLWFVDCDIDGQGKKWRAAQRSGDTFYFPGGFHEAVDVFDESGCRYVGPFGEEDLLAFIEVAEQVSSFRLLRQDVPGEAVIPAGMANGMLTAAGVVRRHSKHSRYNWR